MTDCHYFRLNRDHSEAVGLLEVQRQCVVRRFPLGRLATPLGSSPGSRTTETWVSAAFSVALPSDIAGWDCELCELRDRGGRVFLVTPHDAHA
jgi:hypothetical protein